ncbi:MAG: hypothetical protein JWO38_7063 [Gemmataceae bacterium]|nr:hypothetical protein [Gemmataceae bacterium]
MPARLTFVGLILLACVVPALRADDVWWSFRPLARPAVPGAGDPKMRAWVRNPVDAFVLAKLTEKDLTPSPEADKRTLVRRLYFDLTGLPPTPDEVTAFLKDTSPDAYEKLVDQLLASKHYGERMARHWMDLVHFAETHGHDQDRVRPNAWRFRDYLIAAFNADTPYARFIQEQIAADVLFPDQPGLIPALGFLSAGPWDESSLRDIREDTIDRQVGHYLDRDDMVTTVMSTFQGLTAQCARCHDHKFDPIAQLDYYRLQAVFAGVGRGDVRYDPDPATAVKRKAIKDALASLEKNDPAALANLDSVELRKAVADWETRHRGDGIAWQVLNFTRVGSEYGATLTKQPDGSIRSEGMRPERDTYTLATRVRLKGVTAVRLELLADDSLPHRGPGRQDNGNLHLSELTIAAAPVKEGMAESAREFPLGNPTSDYDQPGWTVAHAVDGKPGTAWGIYPQVGKSHEAVFELKTPVGDGRETEITFRLAQLHGGGHLIGRFRLSVTTAASPVKVSVVPPALREVLATPSAKRTPQQVRELAAHVYREKLATELAALPAAHNTYAAAPNFTADGSHRPPPSPRVVHLLKRGDIRKPGEAVGPGALTCLPGVSDTFDLPETHIEGARRAALAKWISDPKNPLTWRVIANRVWQEHFGRGLVGTPSDFGKMGQLSTHPELLDWLAAEFRDNGQSLKKLHKLIVTSATYRQASRHDPKFAATDVDNRFLWRGNRARLDAEQVRDAILMLSGRLDRTIGGLSDQQFAMRPGIHVTPIVEYGKFDWDRPQGHRRSVYRFVFRTLPDPLVDCLDGADASQLTPKRNESVTAPQALALLNNEFVLVHSRAFAARLEKQSADRDKQVLLACEHVWGRQPTADEQKALAAYAAKHGLPNLCRVLFNSNEFLFVD